MATNVVVCCGAASSDPAVATSDVQLHMIIFSPDTVGAASGEYDRGAIDGFRGAQPAHCSKACQRRMKGQQRADPEFRIVENPMSQPQHTIPMRRQTLFPVSRGGGGA
jgi:hypothetical protein